MASWEIPGTDYELTTDSDEADVVDVTDPTSYNDPVQQHDAVSTDWTSYSDTGDSFTDATTNTAAAGWEAADQQVRDIERATLDNDALSVQEGYQNVLTETAEGFAWAATGGEFDEEITAADASEALTEAAGRSRSWLDETTDDTVLDNPATDVAVAGTEMFITEPAENVFQSGSGLSFDDRRETEATGGAEAALDVALSATGIQVARGGAGALRSARQFDNLGDVFNTANRAEGGSNLRFTDDDRGSFDLGGTGGGGGADETTQAADESGFNWLDDSDLQSADDSPSLVPDSATDGPSPDASVDQTGGFNWLNDSDLQQPRGASAADDSPPALPAADETAQQADESGFNWLDDSDLQPARGGDETAQATDDDVAQAMNDLDGTSSGSPVENVLNRRGSTDASATVNRGEDATNADDGGWLLGRTNASATVNRGENASGADDSGSLWDDMLNRGDDAENPRDPDGSSDPENPRDPDGSSDPENPRDPDGSSGSTPDDDGGWLARQRERFFGSGYRAAGTMTGAFLAGGAISEYGDLGDAPGEMTVTDENGNVYQLAEVEQLEATPDYPNGGIVYAVTQNAQNIGYWVMLGMSGRNIFVLDSNGDSRRAKIDPEDYQAMAGGQQAQQNGGANR